MKITIGLMRSISLALLMNFSAIVLIFNSNGGSMVPQMQFTLPATTFEMPENPVREGYVFGGWYYVGEGDASEPVIFDENFDWTQIGTNGSTFTLNVYAKWVEEERNVVGLPTQLLPDEVYYTSIIIDLDEEATPLADALPKTDQILGMYYYVLGFMLILSGMALKRK